MTNSFEKIEIPQCISASRHTLGGNDYIAIKTSDKVSFCLQNKDTLDKMVEFSFNVQFVCNLKHTNVWAIETEEEYLKLTVLPENNVHSFKLSGNEEFIVGAAAGNRFLLVKTCEHLPNDGQIIRVYLLDIENEILMNTSDSVMIHSYHMPYILICNGEESIVAENAEVYPYELKEARKGKLHSYTNDILMVSVENLILSLAQSEEVKWNTIRSAKENHFLQILHTTDSIIYYSEVDMEETQTFLGRYHLLRDSDEILSVIENRVDKAVFENSMLRYAYKWNGENEKIDVYDAKGGIIAKIDYSEMTVDNEDLELNDILSILDEKYVVFEATDYKEDDPRQIRIVYDIMNGDFFTYSSPLIQYNDSIY